MKLNCLYDTEICPKDIFDSMKINIYNNFTNSNFSSISNEYLPNRIKLFDLIKKISSKMGFKSQTYFLSIYYLDILFSQNKKIECNYNIMGLACLLLSAKYCENDPAVPELKYFIRIYNRIVGSRNSISVSDLFYHEVITCKMLNHKLNYYTVYDFNSFFFNHNILKQEQLNDLNISYDKNNNIDRDNKYSIKTKKILEKIYRKSRYYLDNLIESPISLKYNTLLLSIYIMKKSIEITLLNEKNIDIFDFTLKDKFLKKTNEHFNSIIIGYYNIDYENNPEYKKLIEEYDFIKIFKHIKKTNEDYNPINIKKITNTSSISFNKTPNKSLNIKSLNQRIADINFSTSKKNFNKLKSSNNIHNKKNSSNSLISFSSQNVPRVSYHQNPNFINQKTFYRNLGIDNCIENYKQQENKNNVLSEKNKDSANNDRNKFLFLFRLNSQNNLNNNKVNDPKNDYMFATSPFKFGNFNNNFNKFDNSKNESIKKTKTKEFENINNSIGKDKYNQNTNNNININVNLNKPYYKKVVQNCGNKLKNFNQISSKLNFDINNNNEVTLNLKINENFSERNNETEKPLYNIVNRMPKYRKNNNNNKEEINDDYSRVKININKRSPMSLTKEINFSSNKKEYNSKIKEKKISKLLNINLNPKLSETNMNTPINSLFVNKKMNSDYFSSTAYINKTNNKKKKFETKTVRSIGGLAKSIDNKITIIKSNNLTQKLNFLITKNNMNTTFKGKDLQMKDNNNDFFDKNKYNNYFIDSNENIFSNTLSTSTKGRYSLMSLKRDKDKEKEKKSIINNNKILLTDFTLSGDENINNINGDINDILDFENIKKYNTKTFKNKELNKSKRIQVKKNKFEGVVSTDKNEEKIRPYIRMKSQNSSIYRDVNDQNNNFKNFEISDGEDINTFNPKNFLLYKKYDEENNINNFAEKNPSTIVINNNININFGNKSSVSASDKKKYNNLIKNSQIQINNNNGPNSISSLLNKIPLCYKNSENNINVRKKKYY